MMIALITPTGNREKQMRLCHKWMQRQTYKGSVLWIIVDDGEYPIERPDGFSNNWSILRHHPTPIWKEGQNTQRRNLQEGCALVKNYQGVESVFIIEDDDYYAPQYLETMVAKLRENFLVGERPTLYYHVEHKKTTLFQNTGHASLFKTAFQRYMLPAFEHILAKHKTGIDFNFWRYVPKSKQHLFKSNQLLSLGMKGMDGRVGIGIGHTIEGGVEQELEKLIGEDAKYYE